MSRNKKVTSVADRTLDSIFRPKSVAVIGATDRAQSIGREILRNLVRSEFQGAVYPVNPKVQVVHSMQAYKKVSDISPAPDLAVVVVPRDHVLPVVRECGRHGVKGLVVITAGFKEVDAEGAKLEAKISDALSKYGMRMVGPNCMGAINTEPDVRLNASFAAAEPIRGNVGFISQSGALGEAILADASDSALGVAMFVSLGNKTDLSANDLLEYWEHNDDIQAILMYLESFGDPARFTRIARRVTRKKPVITVKAGRTAAGAKAASSHTGSIVGLDIATESLLEQCGVLRVSSLEEMFVKAQALANQPVPEGGDRVAILTNAGGPGILCTDALVGYGLPLAELSDKTQKALKKALPPEAAVANPVDMIASADAERYRAALKHLLADKGVDAVIAIFVSPIMIDAFEVARAIAEASGKGKPILSVFMGKQRSDEGIDELRSNRVPVYRFPEEAAAGMAALCRYRTLRDAPQGKEVSFKVDRAKGKRILSKVRREKRVSLKPSEVSALLEAYGFPLAPARSCRTAAEAIAAAQEFGYPAVLKIESDLISHKTDVGGVKVDLRNGDEVAAAFREMTEALREQDPNLTVAVQPMITGGHEVILGMTRDGQFGPVMMFGLGGIYVEVMRDISVRIHPLTDLDAKQMVESVRGYPLLAGSRGEDPVALDLLFDTLLRLSQLVGDFPGEIEELDLNPFILTPRADGSFVVDARIDLVQ